MEAAYFSAAIPEPYRILGLPLKPLSLGRYKLLKRFGCAFVADGEARAGVQDLVLGVAICSMRVREFLDALRDGSIQKKVAGWSRSICPMAWIGVLPIIGKAWRKRYAFNAFEKMGLFKSYLEDGSKVPKYWDEGKDTQQSGAHWAQSVEVILRGELGWTDEEIDEAPLTKALADYFRFAESQGLVRLMTPDEEAMIAQMEGSNGA